MVSINLAFHRVFESVTAFMFAAAPAISSAPQYRQNVPVATGDIAIVVIGGAAILAFGVALMAAWNRFNPPSDRGR